MLSTRFYFYFGVILSEHCCNGAKPRLPVGRVSAWHCLHGIPVLPSFLPGFGRACAKRVHILPSQICILSCCEAFQIGCERRPESLLEFDRMTCVLVLGCIRWRALSVGAVPCPLLLAIQSLHAGVGANCCGCVLGTEFVLSLHNRYVCTG